MNKNNKGDKEMEKKKKKSSVCKREIQSNMTKAKLDGTKRRMENCSALLVGPVFCCLYKVIHYKV